MQIPIYPPPQVKSIYNITSKICSFGAERNNELKSDTFVRRNVSADDGSFNAFRKWSDETDFISKVKDIVERTGKILGSGFEGTTYEIPNTDNWVVKAYKRSSYVPLSLDKSEISEISDISPELNIGQPIALVRIPSGSNYSHQYWILKKQTGKTYGIAQAYSDSVEPAFIKKHLESLSVLSSMPQSAFDKCIRDIKYIVSQGYQIDYANPNNFMINSDENEIRFVDINDKLTESEKQFSGVLYGLLDGDFMYNFNLSNDDTPEKKESDRLSKIIIDKYLSAMKSNNVKFEDSEMFEALLNYNSFCIGNTDDSIYEKKLYLKKQGLYE